MWCYKVQAQCQFEMLSLSVKMLQILKWTTLFSKCCLWPSILQIWSFVYTVSSNRSAPAACCGRSRCESSGARMFSGHLLSVSLRGMNRHKDRHRSTINAWIAGGYWAPRSASFVGQCLFFWWLILIVLTAVFLQHKARESHKSWTTETQEAAVIVSLTAALCETQTEMSRLIMN